MKSPNTITTIFFDVGDTLLTPARPEGDVVVEIAAKQGLSLIAQEVTNKVPEMYQLYEHLYEQDDSFWSDNQRAMSIWLEMYRYLCSLLKIPKSYHDSIADAVYQYYFSPLAWTTFPDVQQTLKTLRAQGLCLGVISNWDSSLRSVLSGLGLADFFADIISSADVTLHKPMPEIFMLALQRLNAQAGNALHVGDHATADVAGARAVGITPVYLNRQGKQLKDTLNISSLAQLLDVISYI